jgi:hypothetical protein
MKLVWMSGSARRFELGELWIHIGGNRAHNLKKTKGSFKGFLLGIYSSAAETKRDVTLTLV